MSPAKLRTDKAIGRAYRDLADDPRARVALEDLLARARRCSCLLSRPIRDDAPHHPVAALRNLARFSRRFVRPLGDWHGDRRSIYGDVSSLARHLLCRYDVPRFLSLVWFGDGTLNAVQKREWYVAHGNGQSVRSLDLPVRMTLHACDLLNGEPGPPVCPRLGAIYRESLSQSILSLPRFRGHPTRTKVR